MASVLLALRVSVKVNTKYEKISHKSRRKTTTKKEPMAGWHTCNTTYSRDVVRWSWCVRLEWNVHWKFSADNGGYEELKDIRINIIKQSTDRHNIIICHLKVVQAERSSETDQIYFCAQCRLVVTLFQFVSKWIFDVVATVIPFRNRSINSPQNSFGVNSWICENQWILRYQINHESFTCDDFVDERCGSMYVSQYFRWVHVRAYVRSTTISV